MGAQHPGHLFHRFESAPHGPEAPIVEKARSATPADPEALRRLRKRVSKEYGRLDFIICNACPPILPLRLEPNAKERIADYISRAISLTLTPLSEFLDLLSAATAVCFDPAGAI